MLSDDFRISQVQKSLRWFEEDNPLLGETKKGPAFLYIEVDNLDAVLTALKGAKVAQPERTAFYGMREIGYQEPGGHYVTFAQPVAAAR